MNRFITTLALALPLLLSAPPASALEEGLDYQTLSPAQRTDAKAGQIEVTEFFWYACPHCFHMDPEVNAWAKRQNKDVVLKRVPAVLNESWAGLARAYYALEAMGLLGKLHGELFNAIHVNRMDLTPPDAFFDWAVTKGVDRKKLADTYNSFGINSKVMRAQQMTKSYKLTGVPAFAVNGKYLTSAYMTGSQPKLFEALDLLVAMERKAGGKKK